MASLTPREWQLILSTATNKISPSVMQFIDAGKRLRIVDKAGKVHEFKLPGLAHVANLQRKDIDKIDCARKVK